MIIPKHRSGAKVGRHAKDKRAYVIRSDIGEAALYCRKIKVSRSQRQATRPRTSTHCMPTRGVTTQQSRDAVMETAELFEAILLHLPISDLINYRLVNRSWCRIIHKSPKLCQKLFLLPTPADNHPLWIYNHHHDTLKQYTTSKEDVRSTRTVAQYAAYEAWRKQHFMMRPSVLNPILFATNPPNLRGSIHRRASLCESICFRFAPDLRKLGTPNIYHEMYLCQPPVEEIQVQFFYHLDKGMRRGRPLTAGSDGLVVKRVGGVKFKDVLKAFLEDVGPGSFLLPSAGYHIEMRPQKRLKSVVYLLGAIFADDDEAREVESKAADKVLSPMARTLMSREVLPEQAQQGKEVGAFWSKEDEEWSVMALDARGAELFGGDSQSAWKS